MRRNIVTRLSTRALLLTALFAVSALCAPSAFVQTKPSPEPAAAQDNKELKARAALYRKFLDNFRGDPAEQKTAYEAGKKYLKKYSDVKDPDNPPIVEYLQRWTAKYEEAVVEFKRWEKNRKSLGPGHGGGRAAEDGDAGVGTGTGADPATKTGKTESTPTPSPTKQPDNPPETDKP